MTIILFIVILLFLIIGHEFGHFIVAKFSGMKVPEFGIGFPPKLWGKKIGSTEYSVNALPFGGFVKIYGEDMAEGQRLQSDSTAFSNRPVYAQAATLAAGPFSNLLIAFLLSSIAFMAGVPAATDSGYNPHNIHGAKFLVLEVLSGSPAEKTGVQTGDEIISISASGVASAITVPEDIPRVIAHAQGPVTLSLMRSGKQVLVTLTPAKGVVEEEPNRAAIGIATAAVGTLKLGFFEALKAGFGETLQNIQNVFAGIISLIAHAFTLSANLSGVAGPVGIATLVGDAASYGLGSILSFAALISINLGVINLFPFPALDGGRLALLLVETISRRKVPVNVANAINTIGFAVLVALMVAITAHDVSRLLA